MTVWPPVGWSVPLLVVVAAVGVDPRRRRAAATAAAVVLAFLAATTEWTSLVRREDPVRRAAFDALRRAARMNPSALRVVTWNLAGTPPLAVLEDHRPDVAFLQEGGLTEPRAGSWAGFEWVAGQDGGVLSRYRLRKLPSRPVGPWAEPQLLLMSLPEGRRAVLASG